MNVQSIASRDYSDNWREFATDLFKYEDADPGYLLLKRAKLDRNTKLRYVMAWCTYYNPGIAAVACQYQGTEFWRYLKSVFPTAQRGSERRHFRGRAGQEALNAWGVIGHPELLIESTYGRTYMDVRKNMRGIAQMGDYFYWKLADIWDTVFEMPVDFTGCERYMPKVPKQGAELIGRLQSLNTTGNAEVGQHMAKHFEWHAPEDLPLVMSTITKHISKLKYGSKGHPHGYKLALQEAETVCCVFKQHAKGKHRMGTRTLKAWHRLELVKPQTVGQVAGAKHVRTLLDGLYAGGIWTPDRLRELARVTEL